MATNFDNQEYRTALETLTYSGAVRKNREDYITQRRKGDDLTDILLHLGSLTANDPYTFANSTDSGVLLPTHATLEQKASGVNTAISTHGNVVLDHYSSLMNRFIQEIVKGVTEISEKKADELKLEGKIREDFIKENVKINVYSRIGRLVRNLPVSEEYQKENANVYKHVKEIEAIGKELDEGRTEELKEKVVEAKDLHPVYAILPRANHWATAGGVQEIVSIKDGIIGKSFVNEDNGKYSFNRDELAKYTKKSNPAYERMALNINELERGLTN